MLLNKRKYHERNIGSTAIDTCHSQDVWRGEIFSEVWKINLLLAMLIAISQLEPIIGAIGGICLVLFLAISSLTAPYRSFYILFGVKFIFDGLWFIRMPGMERIGMLHLFVLPLIIVVFHKHAFKFNYHNSKRYVWLFIFYLFWVGSAVFLNGYGFNLDIIIRHAGPLLGFWIGTKYIKNKKDLDFLLLLVCFSTLLPSIALMVQFFLAKIGIPILYGKYEFYRGLRYSGIYYDPGTMGLVNISALLAGFYLLTVGRLSRRKTWQVSTIIVLNICCALIGQTRSTLGVLIFLTFCFMVSSFKRFAFIMMGAPIIIFSLWSKIDSVITRSSADMLVTNINVNTILEDKNASGLLSGRMSVWQNIWDRFHHGSSLQQALGFGEMSNAHSSYFHLLLVIGYLGLIFYILIHALLCLSLLKRKNTTGVRKNSHISYRDMIKPRPIFSNNKLTRKSPESKLITERSPPPKKIDIKIVGIGIVFSILAVGISLNVTVYTSFQWILYLVIGAILNSAHEDDSVAQT